MRADWEAVQLSEIARRLTRKNAEGNDNVLTICARDGLVNQETYFNKRVASKNLSKYFLLHRGDFAYNKSSSNGYPIGAIKRLEKYPKGVVSPLYICFEIEDTGKAEPDFLVQFFESGLFEKEVRSIAKEGARSHGALNVKPAEFLALQLPLPPFPEQRKIAAILSSVDEVIEKTDAMIEQLQVVKRAMMQELLTRGLPGRHTRFKQTEIGEIPEEWEVVELGEVLDDIEAGWSPKCETRAAEGSEWGVLKVSSVSGGVYKELENKALPSDLDPRPAIEVKHGDVLLARASGVLDLVGRVVFVWDTRPKLMLSDKVMRLVPSRRLRPLFLNCVMSLDDVRLQVLERTTGSHMRNLSQKALRRVVIGLPPVGEQNLIEDALSSVSRRIDAEERALATNREVKAALMSVLLTGEVRVTPHEEAA